MLLQTTNVSFNSMYHFGAKYFSIKGSEILHYFNVTVSNNKEMVNSFPVADPGFPVWGRGHQQRPPGSANAKFHICLSTTLTLIYI